MQKLTVFTLKIEEKHQKMHFFEEKTKKVAEKFGGTKKKSYLCNRLRKVRALSSAGLEHLPYKQRVGGSNPSAPTGVFPVIHFSGCRDFFKGV
jgi:hypothetical protein